MFTDVTTESRVELVCISQRWDKIMCHKDGYQITWYKDGSQVTWGTWYRSESAIWRVDTSLSVVPVRICYLTIKLLVNITIHQSRECNTPMKQLVNKYLRWKLQVHLLQMWYEHLHKSYYIYIYEGKFMHNHERNILHTVLHRSITWQAMMTLFP